jgi:hypothetical protein
VENTLLIDQKGDVVSEDVANETLQFVWDILEKAIAFSKSSSGDVDPSTSLYDFFVEEGRRMLEQGHWTEYQKTLVLSMSEMWGAYVGDRVERQSLKFFFLEDCIESGKFLLRCSSFSLLISR